MLIAWEKPERCNSRGKEVGEVGGEPSKEKLEPWRSDVIVTQWDTINGFLRLETSRAGGGKQGAE